MAVLFEEPEILAELTRLVDHETMPDRAYALSVHGRLVRFAVNRPGLPTQMWFEPEVPALRRAMSWMAGRLPIHSYL